MSEENNCFYVSARGIRKSCDLYSLLNHSDLGHYNFNNLKDNDVLFIKTDALYNFSQIIDNINCRFILVSGSSDYIIPNHLFNNIDDFIRLVENNKIIHWFVENCVYNHSKISNIPIGLDYHTLYGNHCMYWGRNCSPIEQENDLINIKNKVKPFYDRLHKCYTTFNHHIIGEEHCVIDRFKYDRIDAMKKIPKELIYFEPNLIPRNETWQNQTEYAFVVSPHGNGLDTHRTWEALVLGCIPVVRKSGLDELYEDLPVLILSDWSELTQELLDRTIEEFKDRSFNYDKLTLKYWMDKVREKKINL